MFLEQGLLPRFEPYWQSAESIFIAHKGHTAGLLQSAYSADCRGLRLKVRVLFLGSFRKAPLYWKFQGLRLMSGEKGTVQFLGNIRLSGVLPVPEGGFCVLFRPDFSHINPKNTRLPVIYLAPDLQAGAPPN